jgi:hypothetical protein
MKKMTVWIVLAAVCGAFFGGCSQLSKVNPVAPSLQTKPVYRVMCVLPSGAYTDANGNKWYADKAYTPGGGYGYDSSMYNWDNLSGPYAGPWFPAGIDSKFYQLQRQGAEILYSFEVSPGLYKVSMRFMEFWPGGAAGGRLFNIAIPKGNVLAANLCVADQAGGVDTALELSYTVYCTSTLLTVDLVNVKNNPEINTIEVIGL